MAYRVCSVTVQLNNFIDNKRFTMAKNKHFTTAGAMLAVGLLLIAVVLEAGYTVNGNWYWTLLILIPILVIANKNRSQKNLRSETDITSFAGWRPSAGFPVDNLSASTSRSAV